MMINIFASGITCVVQGRQFTQLFPFYEWGNEAWRYDLLEISLFLSYKHTDTHRNSKKEWEVS